MTVHCAWVRFGRDDGKRVGFFATPEGVSGPLPALLLLQEAWGVDEHMQDLARRFAAAGYAVLAPDLFAIEDGERPKSATPERIAALVAFLNTVPMAAWFDAKARAGELEKIADTAERARVSETAESLFGEGGLLSRRAEYVHHLGDAVTFLREQEPLTKGAPLGAIGFCMGGGLAGALAAHDARLSAAVVFYGAAPPPEVASRVACPILGFYAADDARVNGTLEPFAIAMKEAGKVFEEHVYPGTKHAFFNDRRPTYEVAAARDAFARTLGFFGRHLVAG